MPSLILGGSHQPAGCCEASSEGSGRTAIDFELCTEWSGPSCTVRHWTELYGALLLGEVPPDEAKFAPGAANRR